MGGTIDRQSQVCWCSRVWGVEATNNRQPQLQGEMAATHDWQPQLPGQVETSHYPQPRVLWRPGALQDETYCKEIEVVFPDQESMAFFVMAKIISCLREEFSALVK